MDFVRQIVNGLGFGIGLVLAVAAMQALFHMGLS